MKLSLIFSILLFGASAFAAPQTADCGNNMVQLRDIIRSKFSRSFDANYAEKFVGKWSGSLTSFEISRGQAFVIRGQPFAICPQADGSFFLYQISDSSNSGSFRLNRSGSAAQLYGGSGIVAMAQGNYAKGAYDMANR